MALIKMVFPSTDALPSGHPIHGSKNFHIQKVDILEPWKVFHCCVRLRECKFFCTRLQLMGFLVIHEILSQVVLDLICVICKLTRRGIDHGVIWV